MGLGEAQVWSPRSIPRLPAFVAAGYSTLLLASIIRFKDRRDADVFMERPRWRRGEELGRPSCLDLLALPAERGLEHPEMTTLFGITADGKTLIRRLRLNRGLENGEKFEIFSSEEKMNP